MNEHFNRTMTPAVPSPTDAMLARETSRSLEELLEHGTEYRFQLLRDDEPGQVFAIPASAMSLLVQLLAEMGEGNAVALTPLHAEVTTQQAADLLHVSRPYLVQLLEQGYIPFRKVGSRRRVRLQDVLAYKQATDAQRHETLNELTSYDQELGLQ